MRTAQVCRRCVRGRTDGAAAPSHSPDTMPPSPTSPLACPLCGTRVQRVQRSFADRCLSLARPLMRCRCAAAGCGWEGLFGLRLAAQLHGGEAAAGAYLPHQVLEPSRGVGRVPQTET